jgi:uncharacterized membrane protein
MNILYCGDDEFASLYLLGTLPGLGHEAIYIPATGSFPGVGDAQVVILSDYPARQVSAHHAQEVAAWVHKGGRLIMLGGWESFNGFGHNYTGHALAPCLPVELDAQDDRRNVPQGLVIRKGPDYEGSDALHWDTPPLICGYNHARARPGTRVLVDMLPVTTDGSSIQLGEAMPLVVRWSWGDGLVTACLTDLAPHWCGGLVDWGAGRQELTTGKEVGSDYPVFLDLLIGA